MLSTRLLLIVLLALVAASVAKEFSHSTGLGTSKEEIVANRAKRRIQLEAILNEAKGDLAEHTEGRKLLEEKDFTALERKISAYERKLETMQGEMDDREVERVLQREKLRYERDAARREERRERASEL